MAEICEKYGDALSSGGRGRRFESSHSDQLNQGLSPDLDTSRGPVSARVIGLQGERLRTDGSRGSCKIKLHRGYYYIVWRANGETARKSLLTKDPAEARRKAEVLCPPIIKGSGDRSDNTINFWLRKRWRAAKDRAVRRGIECTLTIDDMWAMWERCGGFCEVSGIPFDLARADGSGQMPWRISLDRIDPSGDYAAENCRLVCVAANAAMNDWGHAAFLHLCRMIVAKNEAG